MLKVPVEVWDPPNPRFLEYIRAVVASLLTRVDLLCIEAGLNDSVERPVAQIPEDAPSPETRLDAISVEVANRFTAADDGG